jgi:hypothetical protein
MLATLVFSAFIAYACESLCAFAAAPTFHITSCLAMAQPTLCIMPLMELIFIFVYRLRIRSSFLSTELTTAWSSIGKVLSQVCKLSAICT